MRHLPKIIPALTLMTSFSTLFCCALPALFVAIGAGATLAGLVSTVPQLVWLSKHKIALFAFSGAMLTLSAVLRYTSRNAPCPIDPVMAGHCQRTRRISLWVYLVSVMIYAIGFFFAFIAPRFL